ncbi:hypothetical protein N0V85_002070 [Neurospora sp. IMI 360204]|nr:hypothetical protein N0V85_002070 [Neurospora sp. IMI 360204]
MRAFILLAFSHLLVAVWAGGYQAGLERIWLWQAYQIDELNAEADRKVGMRCPSYKSHFKPPACAVPWVPCVGAGGRCSFDELMDFIQPSDAAPAAPQDLNNPEAPRPQTQWAVYDANKEIDIKATAKNIYKINKGRDADVPGHQKLKGAGESYPDFVKKLSQTVDDTYKAHDDADKDLWKQFDDLREEIRVARVGDHGKHLLEAAKKKLGSKYELVKERLGRNPATKKAWDTLDLEATVAKNTKVDEKGVSNADVVRKDLEDFPPPSLPPCHSSGAGNQLAGIGEDCQQYGFSSSADASPNLGLLGRLCSGAGTGVGETNASTVRDRDWARKGTE